MRFTSRENLSLAIKDITDGCASWRLWYMLGINEITHRYRRSTLSPFWLTLSIGVQILVMGFLFGFLFQHKIEHFLPFLCISLILWNFLSTTVMDGAATLTSAGSLITQVKRPFSVYILQTIWRNIVILGHTVVIFVIIALVYGMYPNNTSFLVPIGFVFFLANISWAVMLTAILSARYRDVPMIVQNAFTVLFWLTPVFYMPEQLGEGLIAKIVIFNPLFHIIEVIRAPLLLETPTATNWAVAISGAVIGWIITILLFSRTRARIPYWI